MGTVWRWVVSCLVALPACRGTDSKVAIPPSAAASSVSSSVPPARVSKAPLRARIDPKPLAYDNVALPPTTVPVVEVKPVRQNYALPLQRAALVNLQRDILAHQILPPGSPELKALLTQGSVIVTPPSWAVRETNFRFDRTYSQLDDLGVPILVTTDAVLHHQHVFFNEVLKLVEVKTMAPMLAALVGGLYDELLRRADGNVMSEALRSELAVLAVARKQLEPSFVPHPAIADFVARDLEAMGSHVGPALSATQSDDVCLASQGHVGRCYSEDFSQYAVRGHYTLSPILSRYFLASMWLGRMGRRVKHDAEIAQQVLLIEAMKHAECQLDGKAVPAAKLLGRLDQLLQFFVGKSDDLTLPEVDTVLRRTLGTAGEVALSGQLLGDLRRELRKLRAPRILSGVVESYGKDAADTTKQETQALRLLGQRFTSDSEVLGSLVFEHVGPNPEHARFAEVAKDAVSNRGDYCDQLPAEARRALAGLERSAFGPEASRCICERSLTLWLAADSPRTNESRGTELTQVCRLMPSSLDVASVMGSALADTYLLPSRKYAGYERELTALRQTQSAQGAPENLYQEWLRAITPLLVPLPKSYPTWMTGKPYEKKSLRTFAASWAELRQDTILYVKQSYTGGRMVATSAGPPEVRPPEAYGIVEARPELYQRVSVFTAQLKSALTALSALDPDVATSIDRMSALLARLSEISRAQLEGKPLDAEAQRLIKRIGGEFVSVVQPMLQALAVATEPSNDPSGGLRSVAANVDEALRVPIVADVHTDVHTGRVLEEGTGPLEWLLAVSRMPDGSLSVAVGPVFSYKEFLHPLSDRLTNEKWRDEMAAGRDLPAPLWWTSDRPLANGFELPPFATPPR